MPLIEVLWFMRHNPAYNTLWAPLAWSTRNSTADEVAFKTMWLVKDIGGKIYGAPD